jgi:hypothetical protein
MTFTPSQVALVCIAAARMAKTRADLAEWVESQRGTFEGVLPCHLAQNVIETAREHYKGLPR